MTIELIPESAPFTREQRAWLNGFFAGYLGIDESSGIEINQAAVTVSSQQTEEEEDYPWHDDSMPIDERIKLAAGKPYRLKLMAAMGQQDCGQCGYYCKTYADAISNGSETDLTLCVPGGRQTRKMLKALVAEGPGKDEAMSVQKTVQTPEYSRNNPYVAKILAIKPLHKEGSIKETYHVAIDLADGKIKYQPGDTLGILPKNGPQLVNAVLEVFNATGKEIITLNKQSTTLQEVMVNQLDVTKPSDEVIEYLARYAKDEDESRALALLVEEGAEEGQDLLEILEDFPSSRPDILELVTHLGKLQPRLYSIASSPNMYTNEVRLTVGTVRYRRKKRLCKGVASAYFADSLKSGDSIKVYVHPSYHFRLPKDGDTPIIMIGPGTGIAPFIAFLQERLMLGHKGKNWVFFGNPHSKTDFFYEEELMRYRKDGLLTKLDTAFSRDQKDKIYVQHRMLQRSRELWKWIHEDGAVIYVCGDASKMARDVDEALHRIAVQTNNLSEEEAKDYIKKVTKERRYLRDVY
jgi:sulfite reductase (NADPH) flavoprotein alpha-component